MKKDKILIAAAIPGFIAIAAILLSFRIPVSPDGLAGFATVAMLLAIAALEYRFLPFRRRAKTATQSRVRPSSVCNPAIGREVDRVPKRSLSGLVALR